MIKTTDEPMEEIIRHARQPQSDIRLRAVLARAFTEAAANGRESERHEPQGFSGLHLTRVIHKSATPDRPAYLRQSLAMPNAQPEQID